MPLVNRGNKVEITNSSNNPIPTDTNDTLNLSLLDITHNRFDRTIWDRNTFFGSDLAVDGTERIVSPNALGVGLEITFPASARIMSIASSNNTDDCVIILRGLDSNFDEQDEEITLTGQTEVDSTLSFIRINDIFVKTANTNPFNLGYIYVSDNTDTFTLGVPQNRLYFAMEIGDNIGKTAVYTVPRGFTWTSTYMYAQTTGTISNPLELRLYRDNSRIGGNTFNLREKFYLQGSEAIDMSHNPELSEMSDLYLTGIKTGGGADPEIHLKLFSILKRN